MINQLKNENFEERKDHDVLIEKFKVNCDKLEHDWSIEKWKHLNDPARRYVNPVGAS